MNIGNGELSAGESLDSMEKVGDVKNLKIGSDTIENKVSKKEKTLVGRPIKMKLPKGVKTGVISMFTGTPRRDRRKHFKNRVRNSSISTAHPHLRSALRIIANYKRTMGIFANTRKDLIVKK